MSATTATRQPWRWPRTIDALQAAPASHRLLLDNDLVRVLEVVIEPGALEPEHTHQAPSVMIIDEPARLRYYQAGTMLFESQPRSGPEPGVSVRWMEPEGPHSVENIDQHRYHAIRIELKRQGSSEMSPLGAGTPLAVVTGASSGLGAIFAERLGERGLNLVLTGRDPNRLKEVRRRVLAASQGCEVTLVTADLANGHGVLTLLREIGDRPIDLLINNAGVGTYGTFDRSDTVREMDVIGVDVAALVRLTRAVLPGMVERGRGGVLNVASTIAFQPAPYQATYGAAKAFVLSFSQALWQETRQHGVTVTALCPGPTRTGFVNSLQNAEASQTAAYTKLDEPGLVVDAGLRALDRGVPVAVPGLRNQAIAFLPRITPRRLITVLSGHYLAPRAAVRRAPADAGTASAWLRSRRRDEFGTAARS